MPKQEEEERFISPLPGVINEEELYHLYGSPKRYCGERFTKRQIAYIVTGVCVLILGLLVLLTFLVFIPDFAQSSINDSTLDITYLEMTDPTNTTSRLISTMVIHADSPFTVTVPVSTLKLIYQGVEIGTTKSPEFKIDKSEVTVNMNDTLYISNQEAFNSFSTDLVNLDYVTVKMSGDIDMKIDLGFSHYTVHNLDFDKNVQLVGCSGLNNITITSFDILTTESGDLNITIDAIMWNPSNVEIKPLGILNFDLWYKGDYLGVSSSDYVNFVMGYNYLFLSGLLYSGVQPSTLDEIFSLYLDGVDVHLIATGSSGNACSIPLYEPSVQSLNLSITLLGAEEGVIVAGYMQENQTEIIAGIKQGVFVDPTVLLLSNTFGSESLLISLHQDILFKGLKIAYYYPTVSSVVPWQNVTLPPYSEVFTWPLPIEVDVEDHPKEFVESLINEIKKGIVELGVNGTMTFVMGNYVCTPYYIQESYNICTEDTLELCDLNVTETTKRQLKMNPNYGTNKYTHLTQEPQIFTKSFSSTIKVRTSPIEKKSNPNSIVHQRNKSRLNRSSRSEVLRVN